MATTERLNGYRAALAAAGVLPAPDLVVESDFSIESGEAAAASLLDLPERPTAIFALQRQRRDRRDCAPPKRAGSPFRTTSRSSASTTPSSPALVTPALTTVRQPLAEMGRMAVSLLLRLLDRQRVEAMNIELATRLVVRESTAAPVTAAAA